MQVTAELRVTITYKGIDRTYFIEWIGPEDGVVGIWHQATAEVLGALKQAPWSLIYIDADEGCAYFKLDKRQPAEVHAPPEKVFGKGAKPFNIDPEAYDEQGNAKGRAGS